MLGRHYSLEGPWWWSSGQHARLLLRRTEFESCWGLLFLLLSTEKNENKHKKVGIGPLFSKNKYSFGVRRLLFLDSSSRSDLSLSVAAKPFKMMIIIITSRERRKTFTITRKEFWSRHYCKMFYCCGRPFYYYSLSLSAICKKSFLLFWFASTVIKSIILF